MIGREDEVRGYRDRVGHVYVFVFLALFGIMCRLFFLQILKGDDLKKFSDTNRLKKDRLFPTRGMIFDRSGKVIVDNRASFDVVLLSQYYPFKPGINRRLAKALQMPIEELEKRLVKAKKGPSFVPSLLKSDVSKDVLAAIEMDADGFPGVDIEATVQRRYPYGDIAAQLLGYIGEVDPRDIKNDPRKRLQPGDYIGKMGIERNYDGYLRGVNGVGYVEVDAMGRRKRTLASGERLLGYVTQTDPLPGDNLYLTLDADLELAASNALKSRGFHGSVVALDPRSGEILALVNDPSYDPSSISGREIDGKVWALLRNNLDRPLRNRAIQDHYPPGSTFKVFLAIAGLAEGLITPKSTVNCVGHVQLGTRRSHCWKRHGIVDLTRSIKESCDVFYYNLGLQLGVDRIAKYARLFGLGAPTGIGISGEQKGLIPDAEWKQRVFKDIWHPGETLSVAIGQGYVDVTPLQLVSAYAAVANGGFVYRPYLVRRVEKMDGTPVKESRPELTRKIDVSPEMLNIVKDGLEKVVNEAGGTAFMSRSTRTTLSGKTGTAQVRSFAAKDIFKKCDQMEISQRHHAWFVGYAPKDNPQIAVVAIAEHGCHGSSAGHVVRDVIDTYMDKYFPGSRIEPSKKLASVGAVPALKRATARVEAREADEEVPPPPSEVRSLPLPEADAEAEAEPTTEEEPIEGGEGE